MTIETKFSINDKVFYMKDNRVRYSFIVQINTKSTEQCYTEDIPEIRTSCVYSLHGEIPTYCDSSLFSTKEELLATL